MKIKYFILSLLEETLTTSLSIFKMMLPVSIIVKLMERTGILEFIGKLLEPLMKVVGLPGATGVVWASAMLSNIYGGMIAFAQFGNSLHLTQAQVTVLCLMMLVAHTFPIELQVAFRAGVKLPVIFMVRFGFALLSGFCLNQYYNITNSGTKISEMNWLPKQESETLLQWFFAEMGRYAYIVVAIFCLLLLMKTLKSLGLLEKLSKALEPILGILGIGHSVIPMTVIGLTTGLLYGGALIIKETQENVIAKIDIFYAMLLMGLCHALIEDTILMISLGADVFGVLVFRIIFSILITYLVVKICQKFPERVLEKLLCRDVGRG